jgi:AraC-like DNA-binding protein
MDIHDGFGTITSPLREGRFTVAPIDTATHYAINRELTVLYLTIPARKFADLVETYELPSDRLDRYAALMLEKRSVYAVLRYLFDTDFSPRTFALFFLGSKVLHLVSALVGSNLQFDTSRPSDQQTDRVIDCIEAHYGSPMTLGELAAVACLSMGQFARVFKATTSEAVWAYVQGRRCERARDIVVLTNAPISRIAFDCGFSSQAHMKRQLSARFGVAPDPIRREAKQ